MRRNAPGEDPDGRGFPEVVLPRSGFELRDRGGPWPGADADRAERPVQSAGAPLRVHRPDSRPANLAVADLEVGGGGKRNLRDGKRQVGRLMKLKSFATLLLCLAAAT